MSNQHQSKPIAHAWEWSVEHSPLLNLTRWVFHRGYPNAKSRALLEQADLPHTLHALIDTTVSRTKLWSKERGEIAQELIAHTQDALETGKAPEEIIGSFGDPKRVAKLLRRSMKRKRPLYWRTLRNARRGVTAFFALLFVVYTVQAVRFFSGEPNITTNYATMINAHNDAYNEDEKAWPVYREIDVAWQLHIRDALARQKEYIEAYNQQIANGDEAIDAGLSAYPRLSLDHPHYAETAQMFRDFEPQFVRLREAMHRPIVGITLGFDSHSIEVAEGVWEMESTPPSEDPNEQGSLMGILLPHLGKLRQFANILSFDTIVAARDGNSERVYQDLSAMFAITRQKSFDGTVISDLVNIAIAQVANNSAQQILNEFPGLLSRDQLIALAHEHSLIRDALFISFEGEVMMFDDFIQRSYTDDGNGNGHITQQGMQLMIDINASMTYPDSIETDPVQMLTGPIALTIAYDRLSQTTRYHRMMDTIMKVQAGGPQFGPLIDYQESLLATNAESLAGLRFSPVDLLMPALGSATERTFQSWMTHDATATMLAIEIYTLDHGTLPESLSQLTPHYLPVIPEDLFDPGQPLKYAVTETGYTIYSVGSDGDDDGAMPYPISDSKWARPTIPSFRDRFPYQLRTQVPITGGLGSTPLPPPLNPDGSPKAGPPQGPDGDWILIDMNPPKQEPDLGPALEDLN